MSTNILKIVISGSFRKHLPGIQDKIKEFKSLGFEVLSPVISTAVNPGEEFVFLESDKDNNPKELEEKHLQAIQEASTLYIFNPDGYLGNSTQMELGFALGVQKPIYSYEEIADVSLKLFCKVASPSQIRQYLSGSI